MAASTDPVISKIWKVRQCFTVDHFTINSPVQMKEEVELDDTYAVLKEQIFFVFDVVVVIV